MPNDLKIFQDLPDWTVFHQPETIAILLQHFPKWRDVSQTLTLPDGRRVWLPLLETEKVLWWSWLEAMPFAFPASPLVEEGVLTHADLEWISQQIGSHAGWFALNIDAMSETIELEGDSAEIIALDTHVLYLQANFEAVHSHFTKTMRYDMRRAERDGVTARRGHGKEDFRAYYDLMLDSAKRWGLKDAPYPLALYEALSDFSSDDVSLWLAEFEGKIIGGLINIFYSPTRVLHWSNATLHEYMKYNPTKLLQREAIQEACFRGATSYNMGPSLGFEGEVLAGVKKSKEALGAIPLNYKIFIRQSAWAMRTRSVIQRVREKI